MLSSIFQLDYILYNIVKNIFKPLCILKSRHSRHQQITKCSQSVHKLVTFLTKAVTKTFINTHLLHFCMTDKQNTRIVFRPTDEQYKRLNNVFLKTGRYRHLSELLRHILEIGLKKLEEN